MPLENEIFYVNPLAGQQIDFVDKSTDPENDQLIYEWLVNNQVVSKEKNLSYKFTEGENTVAQRVSDGKSVSEKSISFIVDPDLSELYHTTELNVEVKGIIYDAGMTAWLNPIPSESRMKYDMKIIHEEIGNGVTIFGSNHDGILKCGELADREGIDKIRLSPRHINSNAKETVNLINQFSIEAEKLRQNSSSEVELQFGVELPLDCSEFFPGDYANRAANFNKYKSSIPGWRNKLHDLLKELANVSRKNFNGKLSYAAMTSNVEQVPWTLLDVDYISTNEYMWEGRSFSDIISSLEKLKSYNKPVVVSEFGSVTASDGCERGGLGWLKPGVYSEEAQAECIRKYLAAINQAHIYGFYLYVYFHPTISGIRDFSQQYSILREKHEQSAVFMSNVELPTQRKKSFWALRSYRVAGS